MNHRGGGEPRYVEMAAKALAAAQPSAVPPPSGDRAEAIAAIERALRARARRRLGPWLVGASAAVVTVAAAAAVLLLLRSPPARPPRPGDVVATAGVRGAHGPRPEELGAGSRRYGPQLIELASGTRLRLAEASSLTVLELGAVQRFRLDAGTLAAEVAKVAAGGRFVVVTADAEVEVKGTRFDVDVDPTAPPEESSSSSSSCRPRTRTRVTVHEGLVVVRHDAGGEVRLGAGGVWPSCETAKARPLSTGHARAVAIVRGRRSPPAAAPAAPIAAPPADEAPPPASSTLADQNDLFAAALAARRRGDAAEALRWLDQLLTRYPQGQLVESARAERRRVTEGASRRQDSW